MQAVLRRSNQTETKEEILRWQSLEVDVTAIVASIVDGDTTPRTLDLTPTEFSLLTTLMRSSFTSFSRQHLLENCLPESEARSAWWIPIFITCVKTRGGGYFRRAG